ncbi:MAG: hypothetical protein ACLQF0_06690 [Dissulfurispiraceae bacterium]
MLRGDVKEFVASLTQEAAYKKYIETSIADTLDDVDVSLSTIQWNKALLEQLEAVLSKEEICRALVEIYSELKKPQWYCSGKAFEFDGNFQITAQFVGEVGFVDPKTKGEVPLEVFIDPISKGMFAIDASYTDQVSDTIVSPFNKDVTLLLEVPDGPTRIAGTDIKVIAKEADAPVILSTRFGDWIPDRGPQVDSLSLSDRLDDKFGDDQKNGDPRNFMADSESTFIAAMRGVNGDMLVGILTDIELAYVEDSSSTERADDVESGNILLPPVEFAAMIAKYKGELAELQDAFPYSDLFLAHREVTCDGRLSLCAFTPLYGQAEMHYSSPYNVRGEIEALDKYLNELAAKEVAGNV